MCYSVTRKGNDAARSVIPHSERFLFDAPLIPFGRLNVPFIQHIEQGLNFWGITRKAACQCCRSAWVKPSKEMVTKLPVPSYTVCGRVAGWQSCSHRGRGKDKQSVFVFEQSASTFPPVMSLPGGPTARLEALGATAFRALNRLSPALGHRAGK